MGATGRVTTSPDHPPKRLDFEHGYLTGHYPLFSVSARMRLVWRVVTPISVAAWSNVMCSANKLFRT